MNEFGDLLMVVGLMMMLVGSIGVAIIGIFTAFTISLPLGFLAVVVIGLIVGVIGQVIADA